MDINGRCNEQVRTRRGYNHGNRSYPSQRIYLVQINGTKNHYKARISSSDNIVKTRK